MKEYDEIDRLQALSDRQALAIERLKSQRNEWIFVRIWNQEERFKQENEIKAKFDKEIESILTPSIKERE